MSRAVCESRRADVADHRYTFEHSNGSCPLMVDAAVQVSFGLIHEIKHDCYRIILDRDSKRLRLFTPTV